MSVSKRRDVWVLDFRWPDGLRTRKVIPTEAKARELDLLIRASRIDGSWRSLRLKLSMESVEVANFGDLADRYREEYVLVVNRSFKTKLAQIIRLRKRLGTIPLDALEGLHLSGYVAWRKKTGVSNATINREIACAKHMITWGRQQGYHSRRPFDDFKRLREVIPEDPRPTEEIIDAVFAELDPIVLPLFTFIREIGCRREEAVSLKHHQIDIAGSAVCFSGNTKSGKPRWVPLTEKAKEAIAAVPRSPLCDYVFYRPDGKTRWFNCRKPWDQARDKTNYSWLRVKHLRKAYAIKLAEGGCEMHHIQAVLGHSSVAVTEKHYAQYSPCSSQRQVLRVLEGGATKNVVTKWSQTGS